MDLTSGKNKWRKSYGTTELWWGMLYPRPAGARHKSGFTSKSWAPTSSEGAKDNSPRRQPREAFSIPSSPGMGRKRAAGRILRPVPGLECLPFLSHGSTPWAILLTPSGLILAYQYAQILANSLESNASLHLHVAHPSQGCGSKFGYNYLKLP